MTDLERREAERAINTAREMLRTAQAMNAEVCNTMRGLRKYITDVLAEIIAALEDDDGDLALDMLKKFSAGLKNHGVVRHLH